MTDWQPIETAPKDGTEIKGRQVFRSGVGGSRHRFMTRRTVWGLIRNRAGEGWLWGARIKHLWAPTHWMPLPATAPA